MHEMGFHCQAAAFKPFITKCNAKRRMQGYKACHHWILDQWKCVRESDESCFSVKTIHKPNVVWWRGDMWGMSEARLGLSVSVKGTFNIIAYKMILNNFVFLPGPTWLHTRAQRKLHKQMDERVWCGKTVLYGVLN